MIVIVSSRDVCVSGRKKGRDRCMVATLDFDVDDVTSLLIIS